MTTPTTPAPSTDLGDQLRRLSSWVDNVPHHARAQVQVRIDQLAALVGQVVADTPDDAA